MVPEKWDVYGTYRNKTTPNKAKKTRTCIKISRHNIAEIYSSMVFTRKIDIYRVEPYSMHVKKIQKQWKMTTLQYSLTTFRSLATSMYPTQSRWRNIVCRPFSCSIRSSKSCPRWASRAIPQAKPTMRTMNTIWIGSDKRGMGVAMRILGGSEITFSSRTFPQMPAWTIRGIKLGWISFGNAFISRACWNPRFHEMNW